MRGPVSQVIRAFGLAGPVVRIQGNVYRVGDWILKEEPDPEEALWRCAIQPLLVSDRFRTPTPRRTLDGELLCGNWTCHSFVSGSVAKNPIDGDFIRILEAGTLFHEATAKIPRPDFLDRRDNIWAAADRIAWGEAACDPDPRVEALYRRLVRISACAADQPAQLIHGDLTGNVLFSDGMPPAVIDFSPYWRPPHYAFGIVLADAFTCHGATESLLDEVLSRWGVSLVPDLAKGLLFRLVVEMSAGGQEDTDSSRFDGFAQLAELLDNRNPG